MPGQRAIDLVLQAYKDQYPDEAEFLDDVARTVAPPEPSEEPLPVAYDAPQSGHPYRGGPPAPELPKGPWRAAWAWLKALLS